MEDATTLRTYYDLNLISPILLTSQFFKVFSDESRQRTVIQMTSLRALQPFANWSSYCTGKAARDMLVKCLAEENPSIATINYSPGPVDTPMITHGITHSGNEETRKTLSFLKASGQLLDCKTTIVKLVRILAQRKYVKGEHVDFYDVE